MINNYHKFLYTGCGQPGVVARLVACLLPMQVALTFVSGTFCSRIFFPLQLIQEEKVVSYWQKNWH